MGWIGIEVPRKRLWSLWSRTSKVLLVDLEGLKRQVEEAGRITRSGATLSIGVSQYVAPTGVKPVKDKKSIKKFAL